MLPFALAALLVLQDAPPADMPDAEAAPAEDTLTEDTAPAEPTDAASLIARTESRWEAWSSIIAETAARSAREAFAADLVYPVIARSDLDEGARAPIMQAGQARIDTVLAQNTRWAAQQLDPEHFIELFTLRPRTARDLLRIAERDPANLGAIVAALEPVALAGLYDGGDFAVMADTLARGEERPQPYGTQTHCEDGMTALYPVDTPEMLDARREALGLPAFDPDGIEAVACAADTAPDNQD